MYKPRYSDHRSALRVAGACCLALAAASGPVHANSYPEKPVQLIVPFPPGGVTDALARVMAKALDRPLGQPMIVVNKPGASGMIASESVKTSVADGYTLLMGHIGTHAVNPALFPNISYKPVDDFVPISLIASTPVMLLVSSKIQADNVAQLAALVKEKPGVLNYASFGAGSSSHLYAELFKSVANLDIVHIPYKGPAPAMQDLLGGQVDMMFDTVASSVPQLKTGKVRALAVASAERVPLAPDVPTFAELGMKQLDGGPWFALFAPKGTPPQIVAKLEREVRTALKTKPVVQALEAQGIHVIGSSASDLSKYQAEEISRWANLVKQFAIKID